MFPTESRTRQKVKEQQIKDSGQEVVRKKRVKVVEHGSDDLGECTDTLPVNDAVDTYYDAGLSGTQVHEYLDCADPDMEMFLTNLEADLTPHNLLYGAESGDATTTRYDDMEAFLVHWSKDGNDNELVDVIEICGGSARTSRVLIRRWHTVKVGLKFDVIVGFDLLKPKDVHYMWMTTRPLVAILATPCTGLAGYASINAARGCPTHFANVEISVQLGMVGGEIALWQMQCRRHFVSENPAGSNLF